MLSFEQRARTGELSQVSRLEQAPHNSNTQQTDEYIQARQAVELSKPPVDYWDPPSRVAPPPLPRRSRVKR